MGVFSRRVLPVCAGVCCCFCPGLRARSKKPIKRYNQYLGDIFKAAEEGTVNEKQIGKLADYAAENPDRIPLIVSKLEERGAKEAHARKAGSTMPAVVRCFAKLTAECGDHMSLVARSSLSLSQKLLESKLTETRALGCRNIEVLLDAQTDTAFASPVDALLPSIIAVAREPVGTDGATTRAAALCTIRAYIIGAVLDSYSRDKSALSGTPGAGQGAAAHGGASSAATTVPAVKEPTSALAPVDAAREQLYGAIASARKTVGPVKGPVAWGRLFPSLSSDLLADPAVVSLSCVWALSLLLSPSAASDYALPFALRPTLSYISNGEFWSAPLGPQVLADLRDSLTLLGATVKRERYIKYQLIQALLELLVDPKSPVPPRNRPEALTVLHSSLQDMGATGASLPGPQGGLRYLQTGAVTEEGGEEAGVGAEGASGQEVKHEEGTQEASETVRVPAMWTSSFGYAASEAICVEALCGMLAGHLAENPPAQQGAGQPGSASVGGDEVGGGVAGRTQAAIVGCAAELAQLIGVPEDYLNALAVTLEGIPAAAAEETKGAVQAVGILALAGLARLSNGSLGGGAASAASTSGASASTIGASGSANGAGAGAVRGVGTAQNGGGEGATAEEPLEFPQRLFNALLQVLSNPDAGARMAAHGLLSSLVGEAQSSSSVGSRTDSGPREEGPKAGLVLAESECSLLLSALWCEINIDDSAGPAVPASAGAASATPASCVAMSSTFRLAVAPGGALLLEEAAQLALSVRAAGAHQDSLPAPSRRCLLTLASSMLRTLITSLPVKDKRALQSLVSEVLPRDPFLAVSEGGEMEEVTAGSPGFGSQQDKEAAAAELAALGPKEKRLQPQRKIADVLAAALTKVPPPSQGDVSGAALTSASAAEITVRLLEEYTPDTYLQALRLSYLSSASELPPSASPSVLLNPPRAPDHGAATASLSTRATSLSPSAGADTAGAEGSSALVPPLTAPLTSGAEGPSSFRRLSGQELVEAVDSPEDGRGGGAPWVPPAEDIVKSMYAQDMTINEEVGGGKDAGGGASAGVSQALAILGAKAS